MASSQYHAQESAAAGRFRVKCSAVVCCRPSTGRSGGGTCCGMCTAWRSSGGRSRGARRSARRLTRTPSNGRPTKMLRAPLAHSLRPCRRPTAPRCALLSSRVLDHSYVCLSPLNSCMHLALPWMVCRLYGSFNRSSLRGNRLSN